MNWPQKTILIAQRPGKWLLDVFFPQTCQGCRTPIKTLGFQPSLCAYCWGQLPTAENAQDYMDAIAQEAFF